MPSGWMALGDSKSGRDLDRTLGPDSRLAFRRPGCQMHWAHWTQGIIFADVDLSNVRTNGMLSSLDS